MCARECVHMRACMLYVCVCLRKKTERAKERDRVMIERNTLYVSFGLYLLFSPPLIAFGLQCCPSHDRCILDSVLFHCPLMSCVFFSGVCPSLFRSFFY